MIVAEEINVSEGNAGGADGDRKKNGYRDSQCQDTESRKCTAGVWGWMRGNYILIKKKIPLKRDKIKNRQGHRLLTSRT